MAVGEELKEVDRIVNAMISSSAIVSYVEMVCSSLWFGKEFSAPQAYERGYAVDHEWWTAGYVPRSSCTFPRRNGEKLFGNERDL